LISDFPTPDSLFNFKLPEYDLFLIGDGSGTTIGNPGGWCCLSFADFSWNFFAGYLNSSTNNFSELIPYIHALWAHENSHKDLKRINTVIICGNGIYQRSANRVLWAGINYFEEIGYIFNWIWVPRNSNELSALADKVAGGLRKEVDSMLRARYSGVEGKDQVAKGK
jgi:hypothetical protein